MQTFLYNCNILIKNKPIYKNTIPVHFIQYNLHFYTKLILVLKGKNKSNCYHLKKGM